MTASPKREAGAPVLKISFAEFVGLMAALMAINALGIDTMLPALPVIGHALGVTSENQAQWIISAYMFGFGGAQIVYGPLADRYGRKPVVLSCVVLYAGMSMLASFATSFPVMIVARVFQGMVAAAARVLVISIVRDCYSGRQMARVMSLSFVVFLAVPILAPGVGQLIMLVAPWNAIFHALAAFAIGVAFWMGLRLPETLHPENRRPIRLQSIATAARKVICDRYSLGYTLALTAMFGSLMGYINSSQQIFAETLGHGDQFAMIFAVTAAGMAIASYVNSRIVERYGSRLVSHLALLGFIATSLLHGIWSLTLGDEVISFTAFQVATMFFFGFTGSNFGSMAMEPMGAIAGTASSIQGTISTIGAALIGIEIGQHFNGSALPVVAGMILCGVAALCCVFITENGKLFYARNAAPPQ